MENASQALIIAGGILIAIIVLSVGVYLFVNYSKVSESYGQSQESKEINKFNTNFTKFKNRENITAQEIITLKKFAEDYFEKSKIKVEVSYPDEAKEDTKFLQEYSVGNNGIIYFKCISIEYDENGRVAKIEFQRKN